MIHEMLTQQSCFFLGCSYLVNLDAKVFSVSVPDHYRQLGIASSASPRAIRAAYRRLLMRYHPDTNGGRRVNETQLSLVLEAGRVLGNPELRTAYDRRMFADRSSSYAAVTVDPPRSLNLSENLKQLGAGVFRRWADLHRRFFNAEKAAQFHQVRRKHSETQDLKFNEHLNAAIRQTHRVNYEFHADGVWRRKDPGVKAKPMATLHKRVRLWLLLIFVLKLWRE